MTRVALLKKEPKICSPCTCVAHFLVSFSSSGDAGILSIRCFHAGQVSRVPDTRLRRVASLSVEGTSVKLVNFFCRFLLLPAAGVCSLCTNTFGKFVITFD